MHNHNQSYQVQDIPTFIQEVLKKHGEKRPIGQSEFLRCFSQDVLIKLKAEYGLSVLSHINEHTNAYLIHSYDGQTIITMGKYF